MPLTADYGRDDLTKNQKKILKALEKGFKVTDSVDPTRKVEPHYFVRDRAVFVSAEYGDGICNYFHHNGPYIHPELKALAAKCGVFAEWENAGCVAFWDV